MIGFSINLFDDLESIKTYIKKMKDAGFRNVFTTIYEPEEIIDDFLYTLRAVATFCKDSGLKLMVGISKESVREVNLKLDPKTLIDSGISGLRVTYDIDNEKIAELSKYMKIAISASHTQKEDIDEIKAFGGNLDNIEAWYYYYERDEIGLSRIYLKNRNKFWEKEGIETVAFAPGTDDHTHDFAPRLTLEKHRGKHPLFATIDLLEYVDVNSVYIGDNVIDDKTIYQFQRYMNDETLVFYVNVLDQEYFELIKGLHRNRIDEAELVIRAENPIQIKDHIVDRYLVSRPKGSLTIDNHKNGRFMGEFHITKQDMELSNKTNVVAHVREEDIDLIDRCYGGVEFEIIENI